MNKVPWEQKEREDVIQPPGEAGVLRGSHKKVKVEKSYPEQKRREKHSRAKSLNKGASMDQLHNSRLQSRG